MEQLVGHGVDTLLLNVYYTDADGKPDKRDLATFLARQLNTWKNQAIAAEGPVVVLRVLHTVDYIPGYGYVENEPKTQAGKRTIDLPEFFIDMLKHHRAKQVERHLKVGEVWENRDLVFPDLTGGYLNPIHVLRMFKKILERAGLPDMPFHDLRHSAATILISMGIHPKVIQELLGHSDISITLGIYGHLFPSMQQDVVDKWQGVFGEKDEDGEEDGGAVLM